MARSTRARAEEAPIDPNPLIVALDVPDLGGAADLARVLKGEVGHLKVGLELFSAHGPEAVTAVAEFGDVFLDVKLHDIPNTVERAGRRLGALGPRFVTVHSLGGADVIRAAVSGLAEGADAAGFDAPKVLAVTILTSMSDDDLGAVGLPSADDAVVGLAELAVGAGAPGIVCAPRDLARVRASIGPEPVVVTPGVRPAGSADDDHARAATPARAMADGADHLVVGRPVTRADDPVAAARAILAEVAA